MTTRLNPNIWLEWNRVVVPDSTTQALYSLQPFADENSFKEPRLRSVSPIERRLSSDEGDPHAPTVTVELADDDGAIRAIIAAAATRGGQGEAAIRLVSETGRKAGTAANDLIRGKVRKLQPGNDRTATMQIAGEVGAMFVGIDMDKTIPTQRIGAEHPNAPEASVGMVYPLIIGEQAGTGATDANGVSVEKGLLPAIDAGDVLMYDDGTEVDPADAVITYLAAPTNLQAVVNGTAGTTSRVYKVTALSYYGETTAASVTASTAPDLLNGTDSVTLTWDTVSGAIAYRVYRDEKRIAILNNGGTYSNPEETYTDVGKEAEAPGPPSANTAQISVTVDGEEAYGWTRFVAAGKACHIEYLYGWDGADGIGPKRGVVDGARIGWDAEVLLPGEADWPHATDYVDIGGIRQTIFYARGPLVTHHRNKSVTLAWSGWGVEDKGDLTGDVIIQAFPALQWLINEEGLKNDGAGYLTGSYGPIEEFANGVPKLKSSKFREAQNLSARFLDDDIGYLINLAITEPTTWRTVLRRFHQTFGSYDATSRLGQFYPVLVDDISLAISTDLSNGLSPLQDETTMSGNLGDETSSSAAPTGAYELLTEEQREHRDTIDIIRWAGQTIHDDKAITRQLFDYAYDADAQRFRVTDAKVEYDPATFGHAAPKSKTKRQCYYTHDEATAFDVTDRYVRRHLFPPREMSYVKDLSALEDDLGTEVLVTHDEGAAGASGDSQTRALVFAHVVDPMAPEDVTLTVRDLSRIHTNGLSPLRNEVTMASGNLGDETSDAYPPTGAWELVA